MTPDHIAEIALIEISRTQREAWNKMTMYIDRDIARCALSGVSTSLEKFVPGLKVIDCDLIGTKPAEVEIIAEIDGARRRFKFAVREYPI